MWDPDAVRTVREIKALCALSAEPECVRLKRMRSHPADLRMWPMSGVANSTMKRARFARFTAGHGPNALVRHFLRPAVPPRSIGEVAMLSRECPCAAFLDVTPGD